jgi:stage III sporulation protein AF
MAWVSGWLKEVVLIIMLAVFIDMLIPSSKLERYIRLVLGLFVLLTLLSPILHLLQKNTDFQQLFRSESVSFVMAAPDQASQSLVQIHARALELQAFSLSDAAALTEKRVSLMMSEQLEQHQELVIYRIIPKIQINAEGLPILQQVEVILTSRSAQQDYPPNSKQVLVEPIQIQFNMGKENLRVLDGVQTNYLQLTKAVKQILQTHWQLHDQQIKVVFMD